MLRTVTFSDAKVAALVNEKFVAAWFNRSPGFRNDDFDTERRIFEHANEAYTTQNICTFVLTPEGRVFHYVAGYLAPEIFIDFFKTALRLREAAFDDRMRPVSDGAARLAAIHAERAKHFASAKKLPDVEARAYRGVKHAHTERCGWVARETLQYFQRLHKSWSEKTALPALADVRYAYQYGNTFTEEGTGASKIAYDKSIPAG